MTINNSPKIGIIVILRDDEYHKYFVEEKAKNFCYIPIPTLFYDWAKLCRQLIRVFFNIIWLVWLKSYRRERTIICCDTRQNAAFLRTFFRIENIILADDVSIRKSTVKELNEIYGKDLVVIKDRFGGSELLPNFFAKMDIPQNSNIFLTIGEYESITDFELSLEAFYLLLNTQIYNISLQKFTFLVVLGDEMDFNQQQQNYFKKLEGLVSRVGMRENVFFLKINPLVCKKMLMKSSLAIIFPNTRGCYKKNLQEALDSGKHIIAPNTRFYRHYLRSKHENPENLLFQPNPVTYAKQMQKLVRTKLIFRLVSSLSCLELQK